MKNYPSRNGFTLVELSIVLVIIGLLIGGLLVAQSMIATTRVLSTARTIGEFDAAVANFYTKYNGMPGDVSVMGCVDDGVFGSYCNDGFLSCPADVNMMGMEFPLLEVRSFWGNLHQSGFMPSSPVFSSTYGATFLVDGATPYSPTVSVGRKVGILASGAASSDFVSANNGPSGNYYILANHGDLSVESSYISSTAAEQTIKGADALALDKKMDDGLAVIGGKVSYYPDANAGAFCTDGIDKYLTGSDAVCAMAISIGMSTGIGRN